MIWTILILLISVIGIVGLIFQKDKTIKNKVLHETSNAVSSSKQMSLEVPNPETANPKQVIQFISNHDSDIITQVYKQLMDSGMKIPDSLDTVFREKISKGYLFKEEHYWRTSIEDYQNEHENLKIYQKAYCFDLKGVHVASYKKKLKDCIIFEMVSLKKEPKNKYDSNAIKVVANSGLIGYVPAEETEIVHKIIEKEHKSFIENVFDIDGYIDATIKIYYN